MPVAAHYGGKNIVRSFLDKVINIRSRHPMSEVSKLDVSDYHKLALKDPQKFNTTKQHELRSKIFFHGRLFALRSKRYWSKPKKDTGVVGDDSYLPDYLIYNYGKNKIRIRFDSVVFYDPFISIKQHYISYKRIFFDLQNLFEYYPEFRDIICHSDRILDMEYVGRLRFKTRMLFKLFLFVRKLETYFFKKSKQKNPHKIWVK
jgi:hypothetical protein